MTAASAPQTRILVVDDDATNLLILERALGPRGFAVSTATDGRQALAMVADQPPDIILLDVEMPGLSGHETCARLKANPDTAGIPVIFLTARDDSEDVIKGFELGAVDYITKPFNLGVLYARVNTHYELKRARDLAERLSERIRQNEERLRTIIGTVQTGLLLVDLSTGEILDANDHTATLTGTGGSDLRGLQLGEVLTDPDHPDREVLPAEITPAGRDLVILGSHGRRRVVRAAGRSFESPGGTTHVVSLQDITDIRVLLEQQVVDIGLATQVLHLVDGPARRLIDLGRDRFLYAALTSVPMAVAGGDHGFIRSTPGPGGRTVASLNDQSGHEVNCILRSIATDFIHTHLLDRGGVGLEARLGDLNTRLSDSGFFAEDDFCTSFTLELDHETLQAQFASCGHPAGLLIRGGSVSRFPTADQSVNFPLAALPGAGFSTGTLDLQPDDRLLLVTDGVTDIPLAAGEPPLSLDDLRAAVASFLVDEPDLPVQALADRLLSHLTTRYRQTVSPPNTNTTRDDVSILALQIEPAASSRETLLTPGDDAAVDASIARLHEQITTEWAAVGLHPRQAARIRTALTEAVLNAWKHGHDRRPEPPIRVRWRAGNLLVIEIEDQGPGFDPRARRTCTTNDALLSESGRGLALITGFSDDVQWYDGGRGIRLTFSLTPPTPGANRLDAVRRLIES